MKQIPSAPELVIVSGEFEQYTPEEAFDFFTKPELLVHWWPKVAEVDLRVGGAYRMSWPQNDWHLRGEYTAIEPGKHLGFTWKWDHDPSSITRKQVDVWFQPYLEAGCRLAVYFSPFQDTPEEQADKQGIIEGWIHFGMLLGGLREGKSE